MSDCPCVTTESPVSPCVLCWHFGGSHDCLHCGQGYNVSDRYDVSEDDLRRLGDYINEKNVGDCMRTDAKLTVVEEENAQLRNRVAELEQLVLERYAKHVIRSWVEKVAAEFVRRAEDESEREDQSESPYYSREHHGRCEAFREAAIFITEHTAKLRVTQ